MKNQSFIARKCETCLYETIPGDELPCKTCKWGFLNGKGIYPDWQPKQNIVMNDEAIAYLIRDNESKARRIKRLETANEIINDVANKMLKRNMGLHAALERCRFEKGGDSCRRGRG